MTQTTDRKRLVIIGGGFGGLEVAKHIDKRLWDVKLIDRNNYHSFPPLFYQVASASLEPAAISFPLRREMRRRCVRGCRFDMGCVEAIDVAAKQIITDYGTVPYDKVIIAAGATNNFFGNTELPGKVYTLKSVGQAIRCRNAILSALERAAMCTDPVLRRALLTFVVIGGGPTGVEIAGALGEMKRDIVRRDYPRISPDEVRVVLCEGTDRLLRTMSEASSADAVRDLGKLCVDIRLGATLTAYDGMKASFADGTALDAAVVIWTAGITGQPIGLRGTDVRAGRGGRFAVDEYNRVIGIDDVYAIGDICAHVDDRYPNGCPQLAQPAIQQGRRLAHNLNRPDRARPFRYRDKGSMATIGRNCAVVDMRRLHFGGWFAWMTWMAVHLITLLGMRNKVMVFLNWMWNYWGLATSLRMILQPSALPLKSVNEKIRNIGHGNQE